MIQKRGARWRVVVQGRRDELTGRRRQLSGSAATERAAVELERALRMQAQRGALERLTLVDVVDEWWSGPPHLAATTLANYRQNLDCHVLPLLGHRRMEDIRPRLVAAFLRDVADKGLAPGTVRKIRTVLSTVVSYAVAMEYAESNAITKVPPPPCAPEARVAPTLDETARILLAAEQTDPDFLAFLWVAAEGGGRRGETLALRWGDIDFDRATITIHAVISTGLDGVHARSQTKSKQPRTIAVSALTLERLRAHRAWAELQLSTAARRSVSVVSDEFVFSGGNGSRRTPVDRQPWRPDSTTRRFRRVKDAAGVRTDIDLHGLRHTMITELLHAGVDPRTVMSRAGHSSPTMTMGVYAKVRPAVDAAAADLWAERLQTAVAELRGETPGSAGSTNAAAEPGERDGQRPTRT